ncbi:MAG: PorV/PorQ family protein [Ignavibacteriota bacterium]|nr:PorV/PorQ family protein [Ignavibacteriales bacterium]MCC7095315.1 PorV/PorQ family protein [Ignavibacteriaceae bacterium]MEB2295068.1 PorV/PorQ family protein [Ignavibacteria bacterium]QKJ95698.1 MAG: PorV/PorQ family protein [Ignavibacteriota bacterium]MCZ7615452.1 PorV/PorQ family protein [Ignavibacteriaceae bacterium]
MKKLINLFTVVFTLLLVLDVAYAGGGNRTGTGGAAQLLIPAGPRGIAMGESNVATSYGVESLFWNPAGVAKIDGSASVLFSHMSYIADIGVEYGAVAANFEGFGVISFSVKALDVGDILVTTTQDPDGTGDTFSPQFLTAGVSYSRQLTERIAVGLTGNFLSEKLGNVSASGFALNVGVIYNDLADINGLSIGVVMKNIGPEMEYDGSGLYTQASVTDLNRPPQYYKIDAAAFELPSTFEIGVGYKPVIDEMNTLQLSTTFQNNNFSPDEYKLGAEYGYNNLFFLRAGYQGGLEVESTDYIFGFTAGAGLNYAFEGISVKVDYAYRDVEYFDGNHIFALTLGF